MKRPGASQVIEGGGFCASRNKGLELAKKLNKLLRAAV